MAEIATLPTAEQTRRVQKVLVAMRADVPSEGDAIMIERAPRNVA